MRIFPKKILLLIAGFLVLLYGVWQARDYMGGPKIYLESPTEGEVFEKSLLIVRGRVVDSRELWLLGRRIITDEEGRFEEDFLLAPGLNFITLEARDKFGHEIREERVVLMK